MTPNHSESQVDNGSGWCLLCIWMGRLHLSWLWTAMTEERALHKTWNIGPLYSECFSEYILFLPDDLVPQNLFFSLCSFTVHFYKVLIKIGTAQEQYELWGGNLNLESKNLCQYSFLKMDEWKMQFIFTGLHVSEDVIPCCLNPEGRLSFWLHLRLCREVRDHWRLP